MLYDYSANAAVQNQGVTWTSEIVLPFRGNEFKTSGHTWDFGDLGEFEVACWVNDYRIEAPFDWWETYDERITYWDGTPMDSEAYYNDLEIGFYGEDLGKFSNTQKTYEKLGQWKMHLWRTKGETEGLSPNPANRWKIELTNVGRYGPPPHPKFTEEWANKFANAGTKEETNTILENLKGTRVSWYDWAANSWGSGLYEIPSESDVSDSKMHLEAREDHPNYRDLTVDNLDLPVAAESSRLRTLTNQGAIDIRQGVISEETGNINRNTLPDYIQQLSVMTTNTIFGTPVNWKRGDLGNLWVRRAMFAAIDWLEMGANAQGPDGFVPMRHQTGMLDSLSETWLSEDFLDSLYDWPLEADTELAAECMRKGGYTKQGGRWVRPDGSKAQLLAKTSAGYGQSYVVAMQTIKGQLDDFGLPVKLQNLSTSAFNTSRDNMTYDFVYLWNNQRSPFSAYTGSGGWWAAKILERDPDFPNSFDGWNDGRWPDNEPVENDKGDVQPPDKYDLRGQPLNQQLPTEVGDISAPEAAGRQPDLGAAGIDSKEINLLSHVQELNKKPGLTEDRLETLMQDVAWYYNYYLPDMWTIAYSDGLMGNVRDYRWAPGGSKALKMSVVTGGTLPEYQVLSGLALEKYNEDYPEP